MEGKSCLIMITGAGADTIISALCEDAGSDVSIITAENKISVNIEKTFFGFY